MKSDKTFGNCNSVQMDHIKTNSAYIIKLIFLLYCLCFLIVCNSYSQDSWNRNSNFPDQRDRAVGFSIGDFGYIGTGSNGQKLCNDFWRYDPKNDNWIEVNRMPSLGRRGAFCFVIGTKAYVGGGVNENSSNDKEFWEYDAQLDKWSKKTICL